MAQFKLLDFIDVGTGGYHTGTSWKVTKDPNGNNIIDSSINDPVNMYVWNTPLPNGLGGYYADLSQVYLWVRVHILNTESYWFKVGPGNQNDQEFVITENGTVVDVVNSIIVGIQ